MLNNIENGYEDSYQKRDRLKGEFELALDDLRNYLGVYKNDATMAKDSLKRIEDNLAKVKQLEEQEKILDENLRQKQKELEKLIPTELDVDKEIDARSSLMDEICSIQENAREILNAMDSIINETEMISEEQPGIMGDLNGTAGVAQIKFEKITELRKQIDELEEGF
jgi:hypothetical protein